MELNFYFHNRARSLWGGPSELLLERSFDHQTTGFIVAVINSNGHMDAAQYQHSLRKLQKIVQNKVVDFLNVRVFTVRTNHLIKSTYSSSGKDRIIVNNQSATVVKEYKQANWS